MSYKTDRTLSVAQVPPYTCGRNPTELAYRGERKKKCHGKKYHGKLAMAYTP
jgi:hypothetical protein